VKDNTLIDFFKSNPVWGILIIILTVLPIVGAVVHILLKAFGRRGLDNTLPELPEEDDETNGSPGEDKDSDKDKDAH
jgi:hypothetical protein